MTCISSATTLEPEAGTLDSELSSKTFFLKRKKNTIGHFIKGRKEDGEETVTNENQEATECKSWTPGIQQTVTKIE